MINIQGVVQVIPLRVNTDSGTIKTEENSEPQPAVVQTLLTANGPVSIIYPTAAIDGIVEMLQKAKKDADEKQPIGDLVIPGSMQEVENMAKAQDELTKSE